MIFPGRLALREIRNNRRFSFFFVLNISLGLLGYLSIDAFKNSVQTSLALRSQEILGADIAVSAGRPFSDPEEKIIESLIENPISAESAELYSMVAFGDSARLVEVVAKQPLFPFYGALVRQNASDLHTRPGEVPRVWVQQELATMFRLQIGDSLKLGDIAFHVSDIITADAGSSSRGFSLAPRIYVDWAQLPATGLIRRGSTITYRRYFKLLPNSDSESLAQRLNQRLDDPGIRVRSHQQASESVGRLQGYLNDYLGLASLVSLFLASIGAAYLFRMFLRRRLKNMATVISLGMDPQRARQVYWIQLVVLGTVAAIGAMAIVYAILPVTFRLVGSFISFPLVAVLAFNTVAMSLVLGIAASVLTCLPFLVELRDLKPALLFLDPEAIAVSIQRTRSLSVVPSVLLYWGMAISVAQSWRTGTLFMAAFLIAVLILGTAGRFVLWLAPKASVSLASRLAFRNLVRSRMGSLSGFLAIGLGALLINLIPQIQTSLNTEIESPEVSEVPSLFIFDIQPEQLGALGDFLGKKGFSLQSLTPLVRARLMAVNHRVFEKEVDGGQMRTRESESESRFRNRGMNLTWRSALSESEKIVAGRDFQAPAEPTNNGETAIPEISVERKFAKRLNLNLGDVISFDVQGVEVEGRIVNFREVRWTSFQPNFFVQFAPGTLEDAPATWLASLQKMSREQKIQIQSSIVREFPNISIIDISQVVEKILGIFTQMAWAIRVMAVLSIFAGFVVLFSIAAHQAATRHQEINLLKILGMKFPTIRQIFAIEFGLLGFFAAGAGTLLSFLMSYGLSIFIFDGAYVFAWGTPLFCVVAMTLLSVGTAMAATRAVLAGKPVRLLSSNL